MDWEPHPVQRLLSERLLQNHHEIKDELVFLGSFEEQMRVIMREIRRKRAMVKKNKQYLPNLGIYCLPVEILQMIFRFAHMERDDKGIMDVLGWSHVSTGFRIVVHGMPSLWNTFSSAMHKDHLALAISLSDALPFHVIINHDEEKVHWALPGQLGITQFLQYMMHHRNRWETLFFRIRETDVLESSPDYALLALLHDFECLSLKELDLVYDEDTPFQENLIREVEDLPAVLSSICREWNLPALKICRAIDNIPLPYSADSLETLEISLSNNWSKGWSLLTLCKLLRRCVNLRNLTMAFDAVFPEDAFDEGDEIVTIEKVENLHVTVSHEICDADLLRFMCLLRLPSLKHLTVELDTERSDLASEVLEVAVPLYSVTETDITLQTLVLKMNGLEVDDIFMSVLFSAAPRVDKLIIEAPRTRFSFYDVAESANDIVCHDVKLRKCIFRNCTHLKAEDMKHVEDFIRRYAKEEVVIEYCRM